MTQQKRIILTIDDDEMAQNIIEGHLYNEGYELIFAKSGAEGITLLEKVAPDVILLDVMMPEMNGFEVCQYLKADKRWRHIPIILVSALCGTDNVVRGLEAGADDFLNKPVTEAELQARLRSMLRIKRQYDELQTTINLRDDLAHMIVHDMRSPLSVIMSYSDLVLRHNIPPEAQQEIGLIRSEAEHLNSFLNDMLFAAKMEAGQPIVNRYPIDVNEIVREVVQSQQIIAQSKNITLTTELPTETKQLALDKNLFQRMLDNLIENAIKYSLSGGIVTLLIEYPIPEPEVQKSMPQLRIKVIDEGPGIAEKDRERIFEKFGIVKAKKAGRNQVGLGLTFCKMFAEAHDGRIFVETNVPTGSIFTIEI